MLFFCWAESIVLFDYLDFQLSSSLSKVKCNNPAWFPPVLQEERL